MSEPSIPNSRATPLFSARWPRTHTWTVWLLPQPFDAVSSLLYLGVLGLFFYERLMGLYSHPLEWGQAGVLTGAIGILLAIDRVEYWFYGPAAPTRMAAVLLGARTLLIGLVAQIDDFSFSPFLYLIIPFSASLYFGTGVSYWVAGLVWLTYILKFTGYQGDWYTSQNGIHLFLIFTVGLVFAIAMAKVVENEQASRERAEQLLAELATSHAQLQSYAAQVEELAATQERNRLARDIHDSLGHYLTVINVQLEKALAFRAGRPTEADRAVDDAKRLARDALQDVRRSVGALRTPQDQESLVLADALAALVEPLQGGALTIALHVEGRQDGFPDAALVALYRAAQEALTNVQKHARAGSVELALTFAADAACLAVCDDGQGLPSAAARAILPWPQGGYGLPGVRERLALVGGSLQVESRPGGGTCLRAHVPRAPLRPGDAPAVPGAGRAR